jgi:hypothetical protein
LPWRRKIYKVSERWALYPWPTGTIVKLNASIINVILTDERTFSSRIDTSASGK